MGIFLEYLKVSLWMTPVLLLALWILPRCAKRYTAKLAYAVWLVLAVRLLIPWNLTLPEERTPIHMELPQTAVVQLEQTPVFFQEDKGEILPVIEESPLVETEETQADPMTPMEGLLLLWLAGGGICLLRTGASTFGLRRLLHRWETVPSAKTASCYEAVAGEKRPPLSICTALESPMAAGLFHTKIYLPHENYSEPELEMILRHEWVHWKRKDLWYKFLLVLVRSIHWYHPLVWLMVKRASRDLEISCDGEAVREKDMAYRKAYSLMILQEAERKIQRQAALTTCFTDGKKALQERLVEILNGEKRKRGVVFLGLALLLALTCGALVSYGGEKNELTTAATATDTEIRTMAAQWAEALSQRDGKIRYDMMGEEAKAQFITEQKEIEGDEWDYHIGWSSPWVNSYEIAVAEGKATITYHMEDSGPQQYVMKEILKFGEENGETVITEYLTSNLYWEDGKVHPVVGMRGIELDDGIWDFMYQSVVGFFSQSNWQIYELEEYTFDIQNVTTERLANGRDEVTVDFALQIVHRNPFRDPDEAAYIQQAKEKGEKEYKVLYEEYYQRQEANLFMQFTCQILPDGGRITEDTCYPDTFRLYLDDGDPHQITFEEKNIASKAFYEENPPDGWYCQVYGTQGTNTVTIERQIIIQDISGRTNNGYFRLKLQQGGVFEVAEDAVITRGEAGEEPFRMTREEWIKWLKEESNGQGGSFTLCFKQNGEDAYIITEAREGYWTKASAERTAEDTSIPSGYPTDSRIISMPFSMTDPEKQHLGLDFSSDGKEVPVYATADGTVTEVAYTSEQGNYIRIDHGNGYTTLFAHLSEQNVRTGDVVKKGDTIGITGATGIATGVHCHYEIQRNSIYQNPEEYL